MKQTMFIAFVIIILQGAAALHGFAGESPLRFVGDADYPPLIYLQQGKVTGFYADVTRALSRVLERPIDIRVTDSEHAQKMLQQEQADALVGISVSEERKILYDFARPIMQVEFSFFLREGTVGIATIGDLNGRTVGVTRGGFPRRALTAFTGIKLKPVATYQEGFSLLEKGVIDAFAADKWVGSYHIHKSNITNIVVEQEPFSIRQNTLAVKKGDRILLEEINRGLQRLADSGELTRIRQKWMREKIVYTTQGHMTTQLIKILLPVAIIILVFLIVWIFLLQRQISRRKRTERELRLSEEKYRDIVDNIIEGIYQSTPDGRFISANQSLARMFGYASPRELIASVTDIRQQTYVDPSQRDVLIKKLGEQGLVINFEFQAYRKDGEKFWVSQNARTVRDASGNILYFEGTSVDITARRQAEEELARTSQLNREIIASVAEGIVIFDCDLRYRLWNPFMERLTGIPADKLLGKKIGDFHSPMKAYNIDDLLLRILDGETLHFPLFPFDSPYSGKTGWAEVTCTRQYNEKHEVIGLIAAIRDVTEKKLLEERLLRAEKMEALGLLAGGVAHDLNNMVGISIGYSEMLLEDIGQSSPLRMPAEHIMQANQKAAAVIQDLLTMARRNVVVSQVLNINRIVSECLRAPDTAKLLALHPGVDIRIDLDPVLLNIKGSPVHIGKSVMNLITNAAEALSGNGVIAVRTENRYLDRPVKGYDHFSQGDYVVLTVSDTGEGISAHDMGRIFEPFYTKKVMGRSSGTGLGLAIVWGAVKDHQGYIDVESQPGKGTTFTLYFPVVREDVPAEPKDAERIAYQGKEETILVVDDVVEQRQLAASLLSKLNYMVASVASGEEAVEFLKKTDVHLVVLDMIMDQGIDGLETYRRILQIRPDQKAIIVSGFAETRRVTEAQQLGAGAYVKKPYILETLGLAVRRELDKNENQRKIQN